MNIKRAKQEIRDSIEAYLSKDEFGEYRIPAIRQRPILLMGPPGLLLFPIPLPTTRGRVLWDFLLL